MNNINFFCISSEHKDCKPLAQLLETACKKFKINFNLIHSENFDFANINLSKKGDIVYRICTSSQATIIERLLIKKGIISFRKPTAQFLNMKNAIEEVIIFHHHNIPTPKTIFNITSNRKLLKKYINQLNGFPIIIKAIGQSQGGIGVIKVESYQSLISLTRYLEEINTDYIMKEYIDVGQPAYSNRAIVLGDKVIFTYQLINDKIDDFRSNSGKKEKKRKIIQPNQRDQKIFVKAVRLLQLELGAVDFIFNQNNELKIFEVNFPFDFERIITDLKFNIHEKMVKFLIDKSNKIIKK